jgi:acetyl-CoA synthetase
MTRSINEIEWFWEAVLDDLDIQFYSPYTNIVDLSKGIQFPRWCVDGKMNIVHNMLNKWQSTVTKDRIAIAWEGEEGKIRKLSYAEIYTEVNRCAGGLKALGVKKGDVVGL